MPHDATFLGWLTTGLYLSAAWLCAMVALDRTRTADQQTRRCSAAAGRPLPLRLAISPAHHLDVRPFWFALAIALVLLALNKQLDLQTSLTDALRAHAEGHGWYGHRRLWQAALIVAAAATTILTVWIVVKLLGQDWRAHAMALAGIGCLFVYLLLRVADIERLGEMTGLPLPGSGGLGVLECAGLLLISADAWRRAIRPRS